MMKHLRARIRLYILTTLLALLVGIVSLAYVRPPSAEGGEMRWGVSFSHKAAEEMGLPWREVYMSVLDELRPQMLMLSVYWPRIEREPDQFDFTEYDFLVGEAEARGIPYTLVIGKRVPRWPECHVPAWARGLSREDEQTRIINMLVEVVERYKHGEYLERWQVENEPFLPHFGECPPPDGDLLDVEIEAVRLTDPTRAIVVTDSGELSLWYAAARRADMFGTTMYRTVWSDRVSPYLGYITYPLPPQFFWLKANLMHLFLGEGKKIFVSELQAEPWGPGYTHQLPREEWEKSMSIEKWYENVNYARAVGFPEVYMWGAEWWYFMKEHRGERNYWDAGADLFRNSPDAI